MGSIVTTIDVGVTGAGAVEGLADALKQADAAAASLQESLRGGLGLEGLGKTAGAVDSFVTSLKAAAKEISSSLAGIRKATEDAAAGIKGASDAAKGLADADKAVADSAKAAADSQKSLADGSAMAGRNMAGAADAGKALADAGKAVADSSPAAAGGIKDVAAASADQARAARDAAAWMAETNKITRDYGLTSAEMAAVVNRSQLSVARSQKALTDVQVTASREAAKAQRAAAAETEVAAGRAHNVVLGVAGALGYGIWKAAQLQTSVTKLYTSAGVPKGELPAITSGILDMSGATGTSQSELASGAYMIGSAGFTKTKDLLGILRAAAQGAKAEGAPLGEVGNALTSLIVSYGMKPSQATSAMNQIIAMVGSGKMTMAGAVTALPQVLPVGSAAGLSFGQVGGALATMTQSGMSPDQASQNLRHTISNLQGPNAVAGAEMYQLGLDPVTLSKNLGRAGLTGTVAEIQAAVKAHTGKDGLVQLDTMNASKAATQDALVMLRHMPPALRQLGQAYLDGGITQKQWIADLKGQPPLLYNLGHQFAATANLAHGFNAALKAGQPEVQTTSAALQKLLGGTDGLNTYLKLSGQHLTTFRANAAGVSEAARDAGTNVKGWEDIQKTFNFQLDRFRYSAEAAATTAGTALLPVATDVMKGAAGVAGFLGQHKKLTVDLAIAGGGLALIEAGRKLASPLTTVLNGVGKIGQALKIPGLDKLAGIGKNAGLGGLGSSATAAAGGLDLVGPAADGAAAALGRIGGIGGLPGPAGTGAHAGGAASSAEQTVIRDAEAAAGAGGAATLGGKALSLAKFAPEFAGRMWWPMAIAMGTKAIGDTIAPAGSSAGALSSTLQHSTLDVPTGGGVTGGFLGWLAAHVPINLGGDPRASGLPGRGSLYSMMTRSAPQGPYSGDFTRSRLAAAGIGPADNQQMIGDLARYKAQYAGHITLPVKIQADDAGLAGISSKLRSLTNITAPKVNMSGVTASVQAGMSSAAAAARSGSGQVTSAVSEIGAKVRSVTASFAGGMASAGASLDQGLASGIASNQGAVVGAATAVANAAASAMRKALEISSPSKKTVRIGEQAVEGLVISLLGGQSAVDAAANALGKAAVPSDIASIVKATSQIGALIRQAVAGKEIPKSEGTALTKMLQKDQARLEALARQRAVLETEIANASQLTTSAVGQASILNASQVTQSGPQAAQSPDEIVSGMQQQAASAKQFSAELTRLQKAGLNATSLAQLAQGGPQSLATAQGIDAGGKAAITAINQSESQIIKASQQMGDVGGVAMYQSGQDIGDGVAKGLKSKLSADGAAMQQLAKQMLQSLEAALGGTGKGSVGYQIGQDIAQGIAAGISASAGTVATAATAAAGGGKGHGHGHAKAKGHDGASHPVAYYGGGSGSGSAAGYSAPEGPAPGFQGGMGLPGALPFGGGYHGGAPVQHHHHYTTHIHVAGSVTAERDLASVVQRHVLRDASNNMSSGWVLPGRAA